MKLPPVPVPAIPAPDLASAGLMSVVEACQFCGLARSELYVRIHDGEIVAAKIGRRRLISRASLTAFVARHLKPAA